MNKSTSDMWELASALYLHGHNVDTLQTVLSNWTKTDIQWTLRKFKNKAERERTILQGRATEGGSRRSRPNSLKLKTENPDDLKSKNSKGGIGVKHSTGAALLSWSELVHKVHILQGTTDKASFGVRSPRSAPIRDHSQLLSKVMLYSACFEDHYHGGRPKDTCYSEIYRYLSQVLSGEEPTQLRAKSAAKVLQLLNRLTGVLESGALHQRVPELLQQTLADITKVQPGSYRGTAPHPSDGSAAADPSVKLFEEPEGVPLKGRAGQQSVGDACEVLDPTDPYFEEKREAVNERLEAIQQATAASLGGIPGLNPLNLQAPLMAKPLQAFPRTYPARADSLSLEPSTSSHKFSFPMRRRTSVPPQQEAALFLSPTKVGEDFGALQ